MKKLFKWIGITLGGLLGLLVLNAIVLYFVGGAKLSRKYDVATETVSIPTDASAIQRGEHLAVIFLCTRCHSEDLSGQVYFEVPGLLSIPTPNLTSGEGGVGSFYTDNDWVRALRHGVGHDGRALFFMLKANHYLGGGDLGGLVAYLKTIPPLDNSLPERRIEPLGNLMMGAGLFPPFAADGLHSVICQQLFPDSKLNYAGRTSWRGIAATQDKVALTTISQTWGRGQRFGFVSVDPDHVYWFAVSNLPEEQTPPPAQRKEFLMRLFQGWHQGRITLLGDAAHAATPRRNASRARPGSANSPEP